MAPPSQSTHDPAVFHFAVLEANFVPSDLRVDGKCDREGWGLRGEPSTLERPGPGGAETLPRSLDRGKVE